MILGKVEWIGWFVELWLVVEFYGWMYCKWVDNVCILLEVLLEIVCFECFEGGMMFVGELREGGWLNVEGGVYIDRWILCEWVDDWILC